MTEREKMAQIIAEYLCPQGKAHARLYGEERMCYSRDNFAECEKVSKCVDALIAAGFGDVKVVERALYNACCEQNKHWCVQCDSFAECDTSNEMCIEAKKHAEELIKQAKKELSEGKKE